MNDSIRQNKTKTHKGIMIAALIGEFECKGHFFLYTSERSEEMSKRGWKHYYTPNIMFPPSKATAYFWSWKVYSNALERTMSALT